MAGFLGFTHRFWQIVSPPAGPPKNADALKFGILGAAKIAPQALIAPAAQNPDVIIHAVAARDQKKAAAFAKKHSIPHVLPTYDAILNDPAIDCVFIPLPNSLHYEWAVKALAKGKHVLLEKPSASNATEASLLFRSPVLLQASAPPPVILEAFHYRFHPSWIRFTEFLDRPNVAHAKVNMVIAKALFGEDDIRFKYELGGGAMVDLCYTSSILRGVFGTEPEECTSCVVVPRPPPRELTDGEFDAAFRFPGGGVGEMHGTLVGGLLQMLNVGESMAVEVVHRGVVVDDDEEGGRALPGDQEKVRVRKVRLGNFIQGAVWHRIDVEDEFVIRRKSKDGTGEVVRTWKVKESHKAYTLRDIGIEQESKPFWNTYKYQLDAFVDRVKGRESPTGIWIEGDDSIGTMRMIDMAYGKSELPVRPTSEFRYQGGEAK